MSLNAFLVGLTGGIAEGKSTCRRIFEELGALTLDADALAHSVYKKGSKTIPLIVSQFGTDVLDGGCIDRRALGRIVFQDPVAMKRLTDIVWPETLALIYQRIEEEKLRVKTQLKLEFNEKLQDPLIFIIEAAVLCDAGWHNIMDHVLVASVKDPNIIKERLVKRNPDLSQSDIDARLALSKKGNALRASELVKNPSLFTMLDTGCSLEELRQQIFSCFSMLQTKAASRSSF